VARRRLRRPRGAAFATRRRGGGALASVRASRIDFSLPVIDTTAFRGRAREQRKTFRACRGNCGDFVDTFVVAIRLECCEKPETQRSELFVSRRPLEPALPAQSVEVVDMYGDALCSGRLALETHPDFLSDPSRGNVRGLKTSHQPIKAKALHRGHAPRPRSHTPTPSRTDERPADKPLQAHTTHVGNSLGMQRFGTFLKTAYLQGRSGAGVEPTERGAATPHRF
jgi:hypothetical protein